MRSFWILAMLAAATPVFALSDSQRLAGLWNDLEFGDWNERVHAVYDLAPFGEKGLDALGYASEDADWQIRLTAVHYMGRLGTPALQELSDVLKHEPCRHVRLAAVHWLGAMGPAAAGVLEQAMDDRSQLVRLNDRYWLGKLGQDEDDNPLSEASEREAAQKEPAGTCLAWPLAGRASWARRRPWRPEVPREDESASAEDFPPAKVLPVRPVLPKRRVQTPLPPARARELDFLLGLSTRNPESFPPGSSGREALAYDPAGGLLRTEDRRLNGQDVSGRPIGEAETMPEGTAGRSASDEPRAGADIMADAGTGKTERDPLPALLRLLADPDESKRGRAADEIGKLGAQAVSAAPRLKKALGDRSPHVRSSAALALGNLGEVADPYVPALVKALSDKAEEVQWSAAIALGRIGTPSARKAFHEKVRLELKALVPDEPTIDR